MIKLSELIKFYESLKPEGEMLMFFDETKYWSTIDKLKDIMKAIGDVTMEKEYFIKFLDVSHILRYETDMEYMKKIRILYELCKDIKMSTDDLGVLISFYQEGPYTLMFKEIKELIKTGKLLSKIYSLREAAYDIARDEAAKLDYLKEEYGKIFIERLQYIVVEKCLSVDKVLEILPSKELIDSSSVVVPAQVYPTFTGEDLVIIRLSSPEGEIEFQETSLESYIKLGICRHGDTIFTTFTKEEYLEDLKSTKKLIKRM